nr:MAG TPA: hypothetical protein [Caudoviricetes sp.]
MRISPSHIIYPYVHKLVTRTFIYCIIDHK